MAPGRSKSGLMANKVFQQKWKDQLANYRKMLAKLKKLKTSKLCSGTSKAYRTALEDDLYLAEAIAKRMFISQQIRARELLREDMHDRFRKKNTEWFDRLLDDFEREADLSKFYPSFVDLFVEPGLVQAKQDAEKLMQKIGLEYATAVKEDEESVLD